MCEICGRESENKNEVSLCEAHHFGLTPEEKKEWKRINRKVKMWSNTVSRTNNDTTRAALDNAVIELLNFETAHNITTENKWNFRSFL